MEKLDTSGLNFILGLADSGGKYALISIAHLNPVFYGEKPSEKLLSDRVLKEAVHELGHLYGKPHCPNSKCVMHFSNTLADTNFKDFSFCPNHKLAFLR